MRIGIQRSQSLLQAAFFILEHQNQSISSNCQLGYNLPMNLFDNAMSMINHRERFFQDLKQIYNQSFGMNLHPIGYLDKEYKIWNESQQEYAGSNHVFIWCDDDYSAFSPLYYKKLDGRIITVFNGENTSVWQEIKSFIEQINRKCMIYSYLK